MDRRSFLRSTALAAGVAALGPGFWERAYSTTARPGVGPYGPLLAADGNGVRLPEGFTSRVLATSGSEVAGYRWHSAPDGGAVFPQEDQGWVYTSNSEVPNGGAGALRFSREGEVVGAYRILSGTTANCAGGPTPWGTWLSCEEHPNGLVHECDVSGPGQGTARPALGVFQHEAVTVDPVRTQLYLTEDERDGRFYRFTPTAYPDLSDGLLEVMLVDPAGRVSWRPALSPDRPQAGHRLPGSAAFAGGEGVWYDADHVYFTTKRDNRVWDLDVRRQVLRVLYDGKAQRGPLSGVDNVVVSQSGDLVVAEDGGNLELILITPDRVVAPLLRVAGHEGSELTGPAFSPDGSRLYFSSQRGPDGRGVTFEVRGPFRTARTGTPARGAQTPAPGDLVAADEGPDPAVLGVVAAAAAAGGAAAVAVARRRRSS